MRVNRTMNPPISIIRFSIVLIISILSIQVYSQSSFYSGWIKTLHGGNFSYHSPQPDVQQSMLIRSISSVDYIEWETERIPENSKEKSVSFIWMFGIDATPDSHPFTLYFNGNEILKFSNPLQSEKTPWEIKGKDGILLRFNTTMLDKYNDPMGYAVLTVPVTLLNQGKSQLIRVKGDNAGSRSWYMTFESTVKEEVKIEQRNALLKGKKNMFVPVNIQIVHLGKPASLKVDIPGLTIHTFPLVTGFNAFEVLVPSVEKDTILRTTIRKDDGKPVIVPLRLFPVKPFTIYLSQHAHTDIGYTRPQTEILPEHLRFIDFALDYCDQTDSYPEDARFHWTCETSWPVEQYLKLRPQNQIDRLLKRIREGRIEVAGLYLNMSDLYDENLLKASLEPLRQFRQLGIPVNTAMQDDVNGVAWCLPEMLSKEGVKYLIMGQNDHRALKPFEIPTLFWWESPGGERILTFRGEHYMHGNFLGILTPEISSFEKALFYYLKNLQSKGYPWDQLGLQFSGYLTDNSPPSTIACDLVKQWNEKYVSPKLQLATAGEFMASMEKAHATEFPAIRAAWPDWWMDGFGSTAIETAFARKAMCDLNVNEDLIKLAGFNENTLPKPILQLREDIRTDLIFFAEHTFTAAESISEPLAENTVIQWGQKAANVWDAVKKNSLLREAAMGYLQQGKSIPNLNSILVFNTLPFQRSGLCQLYVDHQILPKNKLFKIMDNQGNQIPAQAVSSRDDGTYWNFFVDVAANEQKQFSIKIFKESPEAETELPFNGILENAWYKLQFDAKKGGIISLTDKELNLELVDQTAEHALGQFIYERLGKNRNQLELRRLDDYTRSFLTNIKISNIHSGSVWESITMTGDHPECAENGSIAIEFRLYKNKKLIEVACRMRKLPVTDPEGVYIAFPFKLEKGIIHCDVAGGDLEAGTGQIEGSSTDWTSVQNYVAVCNDKTQIVMVSPEIPLYQFGGINLGKFRRKYVPETNHIYSWVLNNYWITNFLASQTGELKWTYQITSSSDIRNSFRQEFGQNQRIPLPGRILPPGK